MSERYGICLLCKGKGEYLYKDDILMIRKVMVCPRCDGTGQGGDAMDYYGQQVNRDHEKDDEEILKGTNQK